MSTFQIDIQISPEARAYFEGHDWLSTNPENLECIVLRSRFNYRIEEATPNNPGGAPEIEILDVLLPESTPGPVTLRATFSQESGRVLEDWAGRQKKPIPDYLKPLLNYALESIAAKHWKTPRNLVQAVHVVPAPQAAG